MAVIRSAEAATMARDAIVLDLGELSRQGDRILGQAKFQAERIVEQAQQERARLIGDAEKVGLDRGEKKGYADGFEKGRKDGAAQALEQVAQDISRLAAAWGDALENFEAMRTALFREARLDVLKLAVAVAERVAKRQIEFDPDAGAAQLEAALELVSRPTRLRIACSPGDRQMLAELLPALQARFVRAGDAEIEEDPALSHGSVIVRTEKGEIDATIETQIERVVHAILPDRRASALPPGAQASSGEQGAESGEA